MVTPSSSRGPVPPENTQARAQEELVLGVDLGGTKILTGLFNSALQPLARSKTHIKDERSPEEVVAKIIETAHETFNQAGVGVADVRAVAIGAPGLISADRLMIRFAPNLEWRDVPLRKMVEESLGLPAWLENDASAATLGVHAVECASAPSQMVGVFVGTGIGGGIIINGKLHSGAGGTAAEFGHMILKLDGPRCGCGARGCFEALASRSAINRRLKKELKDGAKSVLSDWLGSKLEKLRSRDLKRAFDAGDKLVREVIEDGARYIGVALANLHHVLNPGLIVLGGGMIEALENEMLPIIKSVAGKYSIEGSAPLEIRASKLGDDAGIYGAAVLARQMISEKQS